MSQVGAKGSTKNPNLYSVTGRGEAQAGMDRGGWRRPG